MMYSAGLNKLLIIWLLLSRNDPFNLKTRDWARDSGIVISDAQYVMQGAGF